MTAEKEVVHVVVVPPVPLDEELVGKIAHIIGKNPYETRLRLTSKIPKIIANYDTVQLAERSANGLRELGVLATAVYNAELHKPPQIFKARHLKFEEQAVMFYNRAGEVKTVRTEEVFLILSARFQAYTEVETTQTKRKINVTATLLTGGIPITKKVEEKVKSQTFESESFSRLYKWTTPDAAIQLSQSNFDYSFLGSEMASSAIANYGLTINKIRAAFPQAIFDDRLTAPFGSNMPATVARDAVEVNCRLIYWQHRTQKS